MGQKSSGQNRPLTFQPLSADQRAEFIDACATAREGFEDAINLVRIHNERHDTGPTAPLGTLNRLTAMLSVRAWESLIREIRTLCAEDPTPEQLESLRRFGGFARFKHETQHNALRVLHDAGAVDLPDCWRIWVPSTGQGRTVRFGQRAHGITGEAGDELCRQVNWWVEVRNGVAHNNPSILAPGTDWEVASLTRNTNREPGEPYWQPAKTINTTTARFSLALFLQLADQSIRALARAAGFDRQDELMLPTAWLDGYACEQVPTTDTPDLLLGFSKSLATSHPA